MNLRQLIDQSDKDRGQSDDDQPYLGQQTSEPKKGQNMHPYYTNYREQQQFQKKGDQTK